MSEHQGNILSAIIDKKRITQTEIAEKLGVSRQSVMQYLKTKRLRDETLHKILTVINITEDEFFEYSNLVEEPQAEYQTTTSLAQTNGNKYAKPYYALDVFGTPGSEIVDQNEEYVMPSYYISIPELKDVDIYIRVTGDSMYPKYRHGDIIGIKKMDNSLFFAWYEPYVVVTRGNYQRLLKYIHPCKEDANSLLLVSYDSTRFEPQPINKEDIYSIWQVLGRVEF